MILAIFIMVIAQSGLDGSREHGNDTGYHDSRYLRGAEANIQISSDRSSEGPPVIHSVLMNGKDSGQLHLHPYETMNISALISNAETACAEIRDMSNQSLSKITMESRDTIFWARIPVPGDMEDVKEYQVEVTAQNSNGWDSILCGRVLRVTHLYLDPVISPAVVVDDYHLTVTARTWQGDPVREGKASATMVAYVDADHFSTHYLGERAIDDFSTIRFSGDVYFTNISLLKIDIDMIDEEHDYLGRISTYALGVPFLMNVTCDREIEKIQGHTLSGPYLPGETMNITLQVPIEATNISYEMYDEDQFESLALGTAQAIIVVNGTQENGTGTAEIASPEDPGSYLLIARGWLNGNESLGYTLVQVQEFGISVSGPSAVERLENLNIRIIPDKMIEDAEMMVSIGSTDGVILVREAKASFDGSGQGTRENEGGDGQEYVFDLTIPLYAANGSYYIVTYYRDHDTSQVLSVGWTIFNVTGGPISPPVEDTNETEEEEDEGWDLIEVVFLLFMSMIFLLVTVGRILLHKKMKEEGGEGDEGGSQEGDEETVGENKEEKGSEEVDDERIGGDDVEEGDIVAENSDDDAATMHKE